MTAGLLGTLHSEQPTTSPSGVNNFGVVERLTQLAPLHRRAALRQAQADAGLSGALPTIDDLRTAECPPVEVWRLASVSYDTGPTPAAVTRETARIMAGLNWRASLPSMPKRDIEGHARRMATQRLDAARVPGVQERHELLNGDQVSAGKALAVLHGPLLAALGTILDGLDRHVIGGHLAAVDEDRIREIAADMAQQELARWQMRADLAHRAGRPVPALTPADRRRQDATWHRRQLRRTAGLARQHLAAALATVGGRPLVDKDGRPRPWQEGDPRPYADDYSLTCRRDRDAAIRTWSAAHLWHPPGTGRPVPMVAIKERSDAAALHRLGTMTAGMDQVAEMIGLMPVMVTLTLPPEWHPAPRQGRRTWTIDRGPAATDAEMTRIWDGFRARLAKSDIQTLGLRVREPHQDGCPHLHALLYVHPHEIADVDRHLTAMCPEPDPAKRVASMLVVIDRTRSRGSTYVMKYLRKTIGTAPSGTDAAPRLGTDARPDDDIDDHLAGDHHDRTRATAGERGRRRYAVLGVHGMQRVWQRVRTATDGEIAASPARVREARAALDDGRWGDALVVMGAMRQAGAHRLRLGYETETVDPETGEITPLVDRYGSPCRRAAWLLDTESPEWRLALGRGGTIERASKSGGRDEEAERQAIRDEWSEVRTRLGWHLDGGVAEKCKENNTVTVSDRYPRSEESRASDEWDDDEFCCMLLTKRVFLAFTGPPDPAGPPSQPLAA